MIEKIVANSFYEDYALYACAARNFFFFNREIADTMTECGKSELRKLETLVDEIHQKIERKLNYFNTNHFINNKQCGVAQW